MDLKLRKRQSTDESPVLRDEQSTKNGSSVDVHLQTNTWKGALVPHSFLPKFLGDNEFLLNSHRPQLNSFKACFKSMLSLHTETWNIWTHVVGSLIFICLSVYYLQRAVYLGQIMSFLIFFLGAIICLGLSGLYHTVLCHSEPMYQLFTKIDYCGVVILIMASWAPWMHYLFYCSVLSKITYASLVSITGCLCIVCILNDRFAHKEFRPMRAAAFVSLGLIGVLPFAHYAIVYGLGGQKHLFVWLVMMAITYIAGAGIYAIRIPERLLPGTFDIWFQSHQIMHVCVVVAALFCYHGATLLADYRINSFINCSEM